MADERPTNPPPQAAQIVAAIQALAGEARQSAHLRAAIRHLGLWLVECADCADAAAGAATPPAPVATAPATAPTPPQPVSTSGSSEPPPRVIEARPIRGPTEVHIDPAVAAAALQRGLGAGAGAIPPRNGGATETILSAADHEVALPVPHLDFKLVENRCRLKAQGCDFAIMRDRMIDAGEPFDRIRGDYDALIARGKTLPDCFLWMVNPKALACEASTLESIRACYTNLADSAAMMGEYTEARGEGHWPTDALWAMAEAQSALYASLLHSPLLKADPDQLLCYGFVRDEARRRHLFMDRFLSIDAVADPAAAPDLAARITALREAAAGERRSAKLRKNAMGKAEYHASRLAECAPEDRDEQIGKIEAAAAAFLEYGGQRHSPSLLRIARAAIETGGPLVTDGSVLRSLVDEADRRSHQPENGDAEDSETRAESPEVAQAREILRGRVVLLVGGEERPLHARNLEQAFELKELRWAPHREHTTLAPIEHEIARADVGLVLLPIRWNGTETGPQIRAWCHEYHKLCVTLKAGYNANQIAHAVLQQVSERLATA